MKKIVITLSMLAACAPVLTAQIVIKDDTPGVYYSAKDYSPLLSSKVFSYTSLANHFKLYQGYVKNANLIIQRRKELEAEGKLASPEYGELTRRFGWEFNGMRLHELYFANLGPVTLGSGSDLRAALAAQYGTFEDWQTSFLALAQMRGIGWAALVYDRPAKRFYNIWINEHDGGLPVGTEILLVMDLFEHAYNMDFQGDKARYALAFETGINWAEVELRFLGK